MSDSSDSEFEVLDTYVDPAEQPIKAARTPARKRNASRVGVGFGGGNDIGLDDGRPSPAKRATPSVPIKKERAESRAKMAKNAPKIIFGLDYGTTFSGIAYTWQEKLDHITVLMNLDNCNQDSPKVPSAIRFDEYGIIWGNAAKGELGSLEWFKLLLVDEKDLPEDVRASEHVLNARARLTELGMTSEGVIGKYLQSLWARCLTKVKTEVAAATVDNSRFHVVVTLPAIWPDYARQRMKDAAEQAGIMDMRPLVADTVLTFVSEPEAAALATLKRVDGRCDIKDGDCFVVCDCGGGTVDLISYKVTSTEPMVVSEIVKGTGSLCGAVFVDDQFKRLLKEKFDDISPVAWNLITPEELQEIMVDDWLKIRSQFTGNVAQGWSIRAPMSLYEEGGIFDARDGRRSLQITSMDLKNVFQPVLEKIKTLVLGQIESVVCKDGQKPKYVILVGGFGRCRYLHEFLSNRTNGIEVLQSQGDEPWTAIARGAVIHGMAVEKVNSSVSVEVRSRISRASYGVICLEKWDKNKHILRDRVFDKQRRIWKATNQMKWLVKEGDDVKTDNKFREDFHRLIDVHDVPDSLSTVIWMCSISPPPSRKDDSVVKYSKMTWTAKIHWDKLPRFFNNRDEEFYEVEFHTEMKRSGGVTDIGVWHKGTRLATRNVKVEFHDRADI